MLYLTSGWVKIPGIGGRSPEVFIKISACGTKRQSLQNAPTVTKTAWFDGLFLKQWFLAWQLSGFMYDVTCIPEMSALNTEMLHSCSMTEWIQTLGELCRQLKPLANWNVMNRLKQSKLSVNWKREKEKKESCVELVGS